MSGEECEVVGLDGEGSREARLVAEFFGAAPRPVVPVECFRRVGRVEEIVGHPGELEGRRAPGIGVGCGSIPYWAS